VAFSALGEGEARTRKGIKDTRFPSAGCHFPPALRPVSPPRMAFGVSARRARVEITGNFDAGASASAQIVRQRYGTRNAPYASATIRAHKDASSAGYRKMSVNGTGIIRRTIIPS